MKHFRITLSILFLLTILSSQNKSFPQVIYKAAGESGIYQNSGPDIKDRTDLFNSLEGMLGYGFKDNLRSADIRLRFRPEFYGISDQLRTFKIRGDAAYHESGKICSWGFRANRQRYNFSGQDLDLSYDSFNLIFDSDWFLIEDLPLSLSAGYGNQKINNDGGQNLDLYLIYISAWDNLSEHTRISGGLYTERFFVNGAGNRPYVNLLNNNDGWRYGPKIIFNYIKYNVINFEYSFLVHNSNLTGNFSYEQLISLVAGRMLTEKLSAFLLADLYFRHFNLNEAGKENFNLLYNSMNIDNRFFLKIGCDISDYSEVYLRTGYQKENLYENQYSISGWNTVLGIEIGN